MTNPLGGLFSLLRKAGLPEEGLDMAGRLRYQQRTEMGPNRGAYGYDSVADEQILMTGEGVPSSMAHEYGHALSHTLGKLPESSVLREERITVPIDYTRDRLPPAANPEGIMGRHLREQTIAVSDEATRHARPEIQQAMREFTLATQEDPRLWEYLTKRVEQRISYLENQKRGAQLRGDAPMVQRLNYQINTLRDRGYTHGTEEMFARAFNDVMFEVDPNTGFTTISDGRTSVKGLDAMRNLIKQLKVDERGNFYGVAAATLGLSQLPTDDASAAEDEMVRKMSASAKETMHSGVREKWEAQLSAPRSTPEATPLPERSAYEEGIRELLAGYGKLPLMALDYSPLMINVPGAPLTEHFGPSVDAFYGNTHFKPEGFGEKLTYNLGKFSDVGLDLGAMALARRAPSMVQHATPVVDRLRPKSAEFEGGRRDFLKGAAATTAAASLPIVGMRAMKHGDTVVAAGKWDPLVDRIYAAKARGTADLYKGSPVDDLGWMRKSERGGFGSTDASVKVDAFKEAYDRKVTGLSADTVTAQEAERQALLDTLPVGKRKAAEKYLRKIEQADERAVRRFDTNDFDEDTAYGAWQDAGQNADEYSASMGSILRQEEGYYQAMDEFEQFLTAQPEVRAYKEQRSKVMMNEIGDELWELERDYLTRNVESHKRLATTEGPFGLTPEQNAKLIGNAQQRLDRHMALKPDQGATPSAQMYDEIMQ